MLINKWLGAVAGVCIVSCCFAQTGKIVKGALRADRRLASAVSGRIKVSLPAFSQTRGFSVSAAAVERYVFKPVKLTPPAKLAFNFEDDAPFSYVLETRAMYEDVMGKFLAFKKEMDVLLYYQSRPAERRALHPEEIARWRTEIDAVDHELASLCWRVSADDPALLAALEYMTYVKWMIYPHAKDIYFTKPLPFRADRVFDKDEFFLQDPSPRAKHWEFASTRAKRISKMLPAGLRVAVVNDFYFFREQLAALHNKGVLFPDGELFIFESAEALLSAMRGQERPFDVILTDIVVAGAGGGGYYLASELRHQGYDGTILAMSSYEATEDLGQKMFERGMDGMISLAGASAYKRGWPADVMQKLLNHFYYRDLHGWEH